MKKAILLCLLAFPAWGGEAVLTWVNPTQNTDGSAITALTGNRLEWSTCSGSAFGTKIGEQAWTTPRTGWTKTSLNPGTDCFRVYASTAAGESVPSNVASKTILAPLPMPPSGLAVAADTSAYSVVKRVDRFVMVKVGEVAPGTQCIADQQVNGYYVVPRAAVTWSGSVKPDVVVATCS